MLSQHNFFYLAVRPFICYQTIKRDKTDELISMQTGMSDPLGKGIKGSTLGTKRSKVKVIGAHTDHTCNHDILKMNKV